MHSHGYGCEGIAMPTSAPRLLGCGCITRSGQTCAHQRARKAEHDQRRPSAAARGYDGKWRVESKAFLAMPENRYCKCGCGRLADMVDHIVPHRGDHRLFWNRANWQPMAMVPCHVSKKQSIESRIDRRPGVVPNFPTRGRDRRGSTARDRAELAFRPQEQS